MRIRRNVKLHQRNIFLYFLEVIGRQLWKEMRRATAAPFCFGPEWAWMAPEGDRTGLAGFIRCCRSKAGVWWMLLSATWGRRGISIIPHCNSQQLIQVSLATAPFIIYRCPLWRSPDFMWTRASIFSNLVTKSKESAPGAAPCIWLAPGLHSELLGKFN